MQVPMTSRLVLLLAAALIACDTHPSAVGYAGGSSATLRLVNASATNLDLASSGSVAPGNGGLVFGAASTCTATDAGAPDLTVRTTGTGTSLGGFSPTLAAANKYVVVAYGDAGAAPQFVTLNTGIFTAGNGQAGLKVFDAAPGTANFDVYVTVPGTALGTASAIGLSFGSSTNFFNVDAATMQVTLTNTGTKTVVFSTTGLSFNAAKNYVLVIAPPAAGTSQLRSFLIAACA